MVPGCLNQQAVKLLLSQGMEVGAKFRSHFKVSASSNGELLAEIGAAQAKLDGLVALDPGLFAKEITGLKGEVAALQGKLDALEQDGASSVVAPGAESDVVGKLNLLLGKHLNRVAKEEEDFAAEQDDLENQVAVLQAKLAVGLRRKLAMDQANEELKEALEVKVASFSSSEFKRDALDLAAASREVEKAISESLSPQWLEQRGMAGLPKEGLQAIILEAFKLANAMPGALGKVVPNAMAFKGKGKRAAEDYPGDWADSEAGDM
jgi:hypothetical protein